MAPDPAIDPGIDPGIDGAINGASSRGLVIAYPDDLPVSRRREEIARAIRDHQVVIVAGETGSGKTTQLPKICLELGRGGGPSGGSGSDGRRSMIGHTQPRRIAARSVATRIAEELGVALGGVVGYQVRFTDQTSPETRVKLMTDGIMLAELQRDRKLRAYDTIIVDEAHERSLNVDFLLGYLRQLLPRRPDLKLIVTSATIDPHRFARHFADTRDRPAPVVEVSGRTYPVEVRYRPLLSVPELGSDPEPDREPVVRDQTEAVTDAVRELVDGTPGTYDAATGGGDVLVFLPGEREIRDTADALTAARLGRPGRQLEVVPLYARLSTAEQQRVFSPHPASVRRVILATNVAETSLTVPGISYVVDSGLARISRYSARTKVQRLPVEPISRASADQRSGRCGRLGPGIAIRLYSEEDLAARPEFTTPEILRTNLASVILQMTALGLARSPADIGKFAFLDPPDRRAVAAGHQLLEELGAFVPGRTRHLTKLGRRLARLPIDPRLARMIVESERHGCTSEVIVIAAALSLRDPRERPAERQAQADQAHARFVDRTSDFLTWLNLWRYLTEQRRELSSSAFRRMCAREYLNYPRVREWQDYESQLRQVAKETGLRVRGRPRRGHPGTDEVPTIDAGAVHQSLLAGLLSQIGLLDERTLPRSGLEQPRSARGRSGPGGARRAMAEYTGARGARFAIFPGSGLKGTAPPAYLMAAELVETSRLWARQNAAIEPEWAERIGAHLVKRVYSEPRWSRKRQAVTAYEKVTLYGVTLAAERPVDYGRIDPPLARELFIRHALVDGDWEPRESEENGRHAFYAHNRGLLAEAYELEHRSRRNDLVVDDQTLVDFYDERLGPDVVSVAHFDTWWNEVRRTDPDLLRFDPAMLTRAADAAELDYETSYPVRWSSGGALDFGLSYRFEPGAEDDGVTIEVPMATLNRIEPDEFTWSVPGLREELVTALIRSLPKALRVNFVPAPSRAREFLSAVPPGRESLVDALARYLRATTGVHVPREAWNWDKVPDHLRPTFRVVDAAGLEAARSKDLDELKAPLRGEVQIALHEAVSADLDRQTADGSAGRTGQRTWTFGAVPESFTTVGAGHEVIAFPAVVDEGGTVGLQAFGAADDALAHHRRGVRRLLLIEVPDPVEQVVAGLSNPDKLALAASPYRTTADLLADCRAAALEAALEVSPPARDVASYAALRDLAASGHRDAVAELIHQVISVLASWRDANRLLSGRVDLPQLPAVSDMKAQLARLMGPGFVADAGSHLRHYPRYLRSIVHRRRRLDERPAADREAMDRIIAVERRYLDLMAARPAGAPPTAALRELRWLIEEFRVSLFSQELGTAQPVSEQRIHKRIAAIPAR
ncbi:MAG: ATP-dependent RNA helicase HrpA [Nocardioides sp.]